MSEKQDAAPVKGIKGFKPDLACRGFQFREGETYTASGKIEVCSNGFHAIPDDANPLAVFCYYSPGTSVYREVVQSGEQDRQDNKLCSAAITVGAEISLGDLIIRAVEWVFARTRLAASNSGECGAASNSGECGAASNSGECGAASNSGECGAASNSGEYGAASNSGRCGAASNSGRRGAASNSGEYGAASNSGRSGAASNSGRRGAASNSGRSGAASNSGRRGAASNSGECGAASNSGECGAASNSGECGAAFSHAPQSRVMCEGDGQALYCTEFGDDGSIKSVACGVTGRKGIKAGVWYTARAGKLVRAA